MDTLEKINQKDLADKLETLSSDPNFRLEMNHEILFRDGDGKIAAGNSLGAILYAVLGKEMALGLVEKNDFSGINEALGIDEMQYMRLRASAKLPELIQELRRDNAF